MSTILTNRLNNILAEEGLEEQNGFSPGRGTIDGSFCVRTMLKKRKEHDVETWAYFLDLVKAFDTVPRKALLIVLGKFGVPEQMVSMIAGMLQGNVVKLQVQKKSAEKDGVMVPVSGMFRRWEYSVGRHVGWAGGQRVGIFRAGCQCEERMGSAPPGERS